MAELDISANSIQLDCSVDSGICVEGATKDLKKKLQEFKRILIILERDKEAMRLLRERLSRIAERKIVKKKKDGQAVCNVCFTPIDTDDSKTCIACCSCAKNVCRDEKCSEWVPKEGEWRCQLCAARRDSYGKASTWVEEQYSVKGAMPLFTCPMRARSEIYIPLCDPNESAFLCNFESVSEAPSPINTNQKQHIREYIEEVLADMIGGSLDATTVAPMSNDENYQQVRNGHELQGVSNVRLRRLIESVIAETIRQPPFSSSGLTTTTAIDSSDIDHRDALPLNGNHCNGNGGQYFESKKYQDLLATAVLNKIVSTHGNGRHSESSPDLTSSSVLDNNHNALNLSKTDESVSSSSSVEPRSESSLTDPIRSINKDDELSPIGNYSTFYDDAANDNIEADRESVLSDFIASHMVPLPHISNDPASEEEEDDEDFISVASSRDAAWEDNWLFKKKKSNKTSSSVGMLVPAPKEDIRALIGDKPTDEVSDLSEAGSDTDDSLEMVSASLEPLNDRLVNQHLIGGKNTKIVLDELVEQTSMISTSSLPENVPPYTETKNEFVVSNDGLNESEPLKISVNSCNKSIGNEAINSDVTKIVSTKAEKLGKETHQVIEDESIVPPPNDFTDDEKMRNLLAKFNEEQNNKTDSGDDNSSSLSPRSSISCALSAGIDRAELDAYEGITDFCVEDEESLASEIDMSMAESSSRRPSVIEILAAIALGPMLAVSASDDRNILSELEVKSLMELNELAMAELNAKNAEERRLGVIVEESFESSCADENRMEAIGIGEETDLLSSPKMVMDAIRELVGKEPRKLDASEDDEERTIEGTEDYDSTVKTEEELGGIVKATKVSVESKVLETSYEDPEQGEEISITPLGIANEVEKDKLVETVKEKCKENKLASAEDTIETGERLNEKQLETEDSIEVIQVKEVDKTNEIQDESIGQCAIQTSENIFVDLHIEKFTTVNEDPVTSEEVKVIRLEHGEMMKQEEQAIEEEGNDEVLGKPNSSVSLDQNIETNSITEDLGVENIIPEDTSSISSESLHTIGSSPENSDYMEFDTTTMVDKREDISSLAELSDRKLQQIREESNPKSEDPKTMNEFILPPPIAFCDQALKTLNKCDKSETVQVTEAHINSETVQAKTEVTSEKNKNDIESKANEQNIKTHNEDLLTDSINSTEDIQKEILPLNEDITKDCEVTSIEETVCQEESEELPDKQPTEELQTKFVIDSSCEQSEKPTIEKFLQAEEIKKEEDTNTTTEEPPSKNVVEEETAVTNQSDTLNEETLPKVQLALEELRPVSLSNHEEKAYVQTADPKTTRQNSVSDSKIEDPNSQEETKSETNVETLTSTESNLVEDDNISTILNASKTEDSPTIEILPEINSSPQLPVYAISDKQATEAPSTEQQIENIEEEIPENNFVSKEIEELNIDKSQSMPLDEEAKTENIAEQQISEESTVDKPCEQLIHETTTSESVVEMQAAVKMGGNENDNPPDENPLQTKQENENPPHPIEEATKSEELLANNITDESPNINKTSAERETEYLQLEEPQVNQKIDEKPIDFQQINKENKDPSNEDPTKSLEEILLPEEPKTEMLPRSELIAESITDEYLEPNDVKKEEELESKIPDDHTVISEELIPTEQQSNKLQTEAVSYENITQDISKEIDRNAETIESDINIEDKPKNVKPDNIEALVSESTVDAKINEDIIQETLNSLKSIEGIALSTKVSSGPSTETQLTGETRTEGVTEMQNSSCHSNKENTDIQNRRQPETEESKDVLEVNTIPESDLQASEEQTKSTSPKAEDLTSDVVPLEKLQPDESKTVVEEEIKTLQIEKLPKEPLLEPTNANKLCDKQTLEKECEFLPHGVSEQTIEVQEALEVESQEETSINCAVKIEEAPAEQVSKASESNEPLTADIASVDPFFKTEILQEAKIPEGNQISVAEATILLKSETANKVSHSEIPAMAETIKKEEESLIKTPEILSESPNLIETAEDKNEEEISETQKNDTFYKNCTSEKPSPTSELQIGEPLENLKTQQRISEELNEISCTEESLKIDNVAEESQLNSQTECLSSEQAFNENKGEEVIVPEEPNSHNETKAATCNQTDDVELVETVESTTICGIETESNIISKAETSPVKQIQTNIPVETPLLVQDAEQLNDAIHKENVEELLEKPQREIPEIDKVSVSAENKIIEPTQPTENIDVELEKEPTTETMQLATESPNANESVVVDGASLLSFAENTTVKSITEIVSNACIIGEDSAQNSAEMPKEEPQTIHQKAEKDYHFSETLKLEVDISEGQSENLVPEGLAVLTESELTEIEEPLEGLELKSKPENGVVVNEVDATEKKPLQKACEIPAVNTEQIQHEQENIDLTILPNTVIEEPKVQRDENLEITAEESKTLNLEEAQINSQSHTKAISLEEETEETAIIIVDEQKMIEQNNGASTSTGSNNIDPQTLVKDVDPGTVYKEGVDVEAATGADAEVNQNKSLDPEERIENVSTEEVSDVCSEKIKSDMLSSVGESQVEDKATAQPTEVNVSISTSTTNIAYNITTEKSIITCKDEAISSEEILVKEILTENTVIEAGEVEQAPDLNNVEATDQPNVVEESNKTLAQPILKATKPDEILQVEATTMPECLLNELKIEDNMSEIVPKEQSEPVTTQSKDVVEPVAEVQTETVEVVTTPSKQYTETEKTINKVINDILTVKEETTEEVPDTIDTEQIEPMKKHDANSIDSEQVDNTSDTVENRAPDACTSKKTDEPALVEDIFETQTTQKLNLTEPVEIHSVEDVPMNEIEKLNINTDNSEESSPTAETISEKTLESSVKTSTEKVEQTEYVNTNFETFESTAESDKDTAPEKIQNENIDENLKSQSEASPLEKIAEGSKSDDETKLSQDTQILGDTEVEDKTSTEALEKATTRNIETSISIVLPKEDEEIATMSTNVRNYEEIVEKTTENEVKIEGEFTTMSQAPLSDTRDSAFKTKDEKIEQAPEVELKRIDEFSADISEPIKSNNSEIETIDNTKEGEKDIVSEKIQQENIGMDQKTQSEDVSVENISEELKSNDQVISPITISKRTEMSDEEENESKISTETIKESTSLLETPTLSKLPKLDEEVNALTTIVKNEETPREDLSIDKGTLAKETTEVLKPQKLILEEAIKISAEEVYVVEGSTSGAILGDLKPKADNERIKDSPITEKEAQNEEKHVIESQAPLIDAPDVLLKTEDEKMKQVTENKANGVDQRTEQILQSPIQNSAEILESIKSTSTEIETVEVTKEREKKIERENVDEDVESQTKVVSDQKITEDLKSNDQVILSINISQDTHKSDDEEGKDEICTETVENSSSLLETTMPSDLPMVDEEITALSLNVDNAAEILIEDVSIDKVEETTKVSRPQEPTSQEAMVISTDKASEVEGAPSEEANNESIKDARITEKEVQIEKESTREPQAALTDAIESASKPKDEQIEKIFTETLEKATSFAEISLPTESFKVNEGITAPTSNVKNTEEVPSEDVSIDNAALVEESTEVSKPQEPTSEEVMTISTEKVERLSAEETLKDTTVDNENIKDEPVPEKDEESVKESEAPLIDTSDSALKTKDEQIEQAPENETKRIEQISEQPIQTSAEVSEPIKAINTDIEICEETKEQEKDIIPEKIANENVDGDVKFQTEVRSVEKIPEELKSNDQDILPIFISQGAQKTVEVDNKDKKFTDSPMVDAETTSISNVEYVEEIPRETVFIDKKTLMEEVTKVAKSQEPVSEKAMKLPTNNVCEVEDLAEAAISDDLEPKVDNETEGSKSQEPNPEIEMKLSTIEAGVVNDSAAELILDDLQSQADKEIIKDAPILEKEVQIKEESLEKSQTPLTDAISSASKLNDEQIEKVPEDEAKQMNEKAEQTLESSNQTSSEVENVECTKDREEDTVPDKIQNKNIEGDLKSQTEVVPTEKDETQKLDEKEINTAPSMLPKVDEEIVSNVKNAEEIPGQDVFIGRKTPVEESTELSISEDPIPEAAIKILINEVCEVESLPSEEISRDLEHDVSNASIQDASIPEEEERKKGSLEESQKQTYDTSVSASKTNDEPEVEVKLIEEPTSQGIQRELTSTVNKTEDQQFEKLIVEETMVVPDSDPAKDNYNNNGARQLQNSSETSTSQDASQNHKDECVAKEESPAIETVTASEIPEALDSKELPKGVVNMTLISEAFSVETKSSTVIISEDVTASSEKIPPENESVLTGVTSEKSTTAAEETPSEADNVLHTKEIADMDIRVVKEEEISAIAFEDSSKTVDVRQNEENPEVVQSNVMSLLTLKEKTITAALENLSESDTVPQTEGFEKTILKELVLDSLELQKTEEVLILETKSAQQIGEVSKTQESTVSVKVTEGSVETITNEEASVCKTITADESKLQDALTLKEKVQSEEATTDSESVKDVGELIKSDEPVCDSQEIHDHLLDSEALVVLQREEHSEKFSDVEAKSEEEKSESQNKAAELDDTSISSKMQKEEITEVSATPTMELTEELKPQAESCFEDTPVHAEEVPSIKRESSIPEVTSSSEDTPVQAEGVPLTDFSEESSIPEVTSSSEDVPILAEEISTSGLNTVKAATSDENIFCQEVLTDCKADTKLEEVLITEEKTEPKSIIGWEGTLAPRIRTESASAVDTIPSELQDSLTGTLSEEIQTSKICVVKTLSIEETAEKAKTLEETSVSLEKPEAAKEIPAEVNADDKKAQTEKIIVSQEAQELKLNAKDENKRSESEEALMLENYQEQKTVDLEMSLSKTMAEASKTQEPVLDSKDIQNLIEGPQIEKALEIKEASEITEGLEKLELTKNVNATVEIDETSKSQGLENLQETVVPAEEVLLEEVTAVDDKSTDFIEAEAPKTVLQDVIIPTDDLKTIEVTQAVILEPADIARSFSGLRISPVPEEVPQIEETAKATKTKEIIEASKAPESTLESKVSQVEIEQIENKESICLNETSIKSFADETQVLTENSKQTIEINPKTIESTKIPKDLEEKIQIEDSTDIKAEQNAKVVEEEETNNLAVDKEIDSLEPKDTSSSFKAAPKITEEVEMENTSEIEPSQIEESMSQKPLPNHECPPVSSEEDQIIKALSVEVATKKGDENEDTVVEEVLSKKVLEEPSFIKESEQIEDTINEKLPTDKIAEALRSQHPTSNLEETPKSFGDEEVSKLVPEELQVKVSEETTEAEKAFILESSVSNVTELVQIEKCFTSEETDGGKSQASISVSKDAPMQCEESPTITETAKAQELVSTDHLLPNDDVPDQISTVPAKDALDVTSTKQIEVPVPPEETSVSEFKNIPEEVPEVIAENAEGVLIPADEVSARPISTAAEGIGLTLAVASCAKLTEDFTEIIAEVSEIPSSEGLAVTCNIITHPPLQPTESLSESAQYPTEDYDKISHPILETCSDKRAPSLAEELRMADVRNDTKEPKSECVIPQMFACENHCFTADSQPTKPSTSDSVATDQPNAQDASQGNHISQAARQHLFAEQSSKKKKHSGSKFRNLTLRDRRFLAELEKRRKQRELIQNYLDTLDCIDTPSYLNEDLYLFESKRSIESSPYSLFIEPSNHCIVGASSTSPTAKSHFLNNILFSDRISSESNCTDDSTTTVIDTFGSMGSGSNSDSGEEFSPDDSTDRESSATASTANNSTITTNNATNQSHIYSPPPKPELRTESACSKLLVSRTTGGNEEHVDDDPLKHLVPGSIAEREYKKWYNAVDMPNNPYSVEALRRRLSGGHDRVLDLPNISPCIEDNPLKLGENPGSEADDKGQERDYARYSRDYYINDAKHASGTTKKSPTSPPQISSPTPTASSIELEERTDSTAEPVEITPVKEMCHKLEKQCRIEADLYLATPVQVIEDIPQAFAEKNATQTVETVASLTTEAVSKLSSETSSLLTYESLTPSEDSDTIRIYDLKKQETRLIKEAAHTTTITMPKSPEKKVRPTELNITPTLSPPIATVSSKSSTPTTFKFLQPKRKLIDPSQVLSIDLDTTPITPSTSEKPVIEADVVHAMPSVKALAKAFLMTSSTCSSSDNKWRKARAKSPLQLFKPTTPTPAANTNRILQNQPEPVIADTTSQGSEDATIASDLSSLETDPPSRIDAETMDSATLARQSSQERALSPVLVSGCLRNNIAFFENLKNK